MKIKNIINKINDFFNTKILKKKKRRNTKTKNLVLKNIEQTSFIKKRKNIVFKNINFELFRKKNKNLYFGVIIGFFVFLIGFIYYGQYFKVEKIEIIKQDNITNMDISYRAIDDIRGKNIFKIDKKELLQKFRNYQENIKDINIGIILPNTIKINIKSYPSIYNTTVNEKSYILTTNGVLIPSKFSEELKEIKIIKTINKNIFIDYKKIFDGKYISKIYDLTNKLKENIVGLQIKELSYYEVERELHIKNQNNVILIFDLDTDSINEQIEKIAIFNKDSLDISKEKIVYIDLRVKNKLFYCTQENICKINLKNIYSYE